ncbi:MAG: HAD-IB family phosphatase [Desulfosalsimonadaceae bacterium]
MAGSSRKVFCDFDGTITARESLEAVLQKFNPNCFDDMMARLKSGEKSIREGVKEMVAGIRSESYPQILEFVRQIPIRPGFENLLDFLDARGIAFIVLSGGIRGMVEARLGPLMERVEQIIAAEVDTGQPMMSVYSPYESDAELVAKAEIIRGFGSVESVVIGDGITDIEMARRGDILFARDSLAKYLDDEKIAYYPWSDFYDIRRQLEKIL